MNTRTLAALAALTLLPMAGNAAPPKPTFEHFPAYLHALRQSQDPDARRIRQEIADGPAALTREKAAARAEGIPLTAKDLLRPPLPADQNAAPLYAEWNAERRKRSLPWGQGASPLRGSYDYSEDYLDQIQKIVDDNQDLFDLLHRATDRPACLGSQDWIKKQPPEPPFLSFAGDREAARELVTESFLLARQGKFGEAARNQARGFRLAAHVEQDTPSLITHLVSNAITAISVSGMQNILSLAGPNAEADAAVEQALASAPPISMKAGLRGEAAITLISLDSAVRTGPPAAWPGVFGELEAAKSIPKSLAPADQAMLNSALDAFEARYLRRLRALLKAADLPAPARAARFAALQPAPAPLQPAPVNPLDLMMESPVALPIPNLAALDPRTQARVEVTRAGARLLAVKAKTGAFPDALPDGFTDPFTGKPLGYRKTEDGFVVYSVGEEGTFPGDRAATNANQEAFFAWPPPAKRPAPAEK